MYPHFFGDEMLEHFFLRRTLRFAANGPLLTTQGTNVPAGDYTVYLEKDSHQHWTLKMMKPFGGKGLFILSPLCP
jgi:hypothetical protein